MAAQAQGPLRDSTALAGGCFTGTEWVFSRLDLEEASGVRSGIQNVQVEQAELTADDVLPGVPRGGL